MPCLRAILQPWGIVVLPFSRGIQKWIKEEGQGGEKLHGHFLNICVSVNDLHLKLCYCHTAESIQVKWVILIEELMIVEKFKSHCLWGDRPLCAPCFPPLSCSRAWYIGLPGVGDIALNLLNKAPNTWEACEFMWDEEKQFWGNSSLNCSWNPSRFCQMMMGGGVWQDPLSYTLDILCNAALLAGNVSFGLETGWLERVDPVNALGSLFCVTFLQRATPDRARSFCSYPGHTYWQSDLGCSLTVLPCCFPLGLTRPEQWMFSMWQGLLSLPPILGIMLSFFLYPSQASISAMQQQVCLTWLLNWIICRFSLTHLDIITIGDVWLIKT